MERSSGAEPRCRTIASMRACGCWAALSLPGLTRQFIMIEKEDGCARRLTRLRASSTRSLPARGGGRAGNAHQAGQ